GPNFWATPPIVAGGAVWTLDTGGSGLYAFDLATGAVRYQSGAIGVNHFASPSESANTIFVPGSNQLLTFSMTPCPVAPAYTGYFNWYDKASSGMYQDNIHLLNPSATTSNGVITLPGAANVAFSVPAGQEKYYSFPQGTIGGPVTVSVTSGPAVIASQRVTYYGSFNEVRARPASSAAMTSYFNWYDKQSTGMYQDNIHLLKPGATAASGTITLPGVLNRAFAVNAGQEAYYSFAQGTIGGPVTVTVTAGPPVIASQRVTFYQSFNEVAASP